MPAEIPQKFALAMKRNPHLARYVESYRRKYGEYPDFKEVLSRDLGKLEKFSIVYPVGDPIFIHVFTDEEGEKRYNVIEPEPIDPERYARIQNMILRLAPSEKTPESKEEYEALIDELLDRVVTTTPGGGFVSRLFGQEKIYLTREELDRVRYHLKKDLVEIGPLTPLTRDPYIEDIHCTGVGPLHLVHKIFGMMETNIVFNTVEELKGYLANLTERIGRPASEQRPIVDASLPDGSRLNVIYSTDVSLKGPSFTIRKFQEEPISITQLIAWGTLSPEVAAYLWLAVENGMSIFISGETASGKTTMLNAILVFIPYDWKVYTAEDTPEVKPPHPTWQRLVTRETGPEESRVSMYDLLRAALRSRPNYIIVGEIRGAEASVAFQAMQTGHPVMATFHASSITKMIQRLTGNPINIPVTFIDNLNIGVFQQAMYYKGSFVRRTISVEEIEGYRKELGGIVTRAVFRWDPIDDKHIFRGLYNSYILEKKIAPLMGFDDPRKVYDELFFRAKILRKMVERNILRYNDVLRVIVRFQRYGREGLPFAV
ncbi:MAG TPA: hypothetical protein ENF25_01965 [Thermoprotei archaeon]|nr:type II/IV secretion system ATPase subunit [Euryarchaeota archaeon]HDJ50948.1 hypothetical protein [Thermoprotei archaeon]